MDDSHIQHCLKYEFDRGSNVKVALKNIQKTYGDDSITDSTCRQCFKKLRSIKSAENNVDKDNAEEADDAFSNENHNNEAENKPLTMPPKKIARRGLALKQQVKPVVVKSGFKFTDSQKNEYTVGQEIGSGGFGRIYDAKQSGTNKLVAVKMEPSMNGPLFTEMHVYLKVLKEVHLTKWRTEHGIEFLGLPSLISSGKLVFEGEDLRYLIIPKYNDSVEAALARSKTCFSLTQVLPLTKAVLNAYWYLHSENYVHADAKAANLLMESKNDFAHVYLIDYGLARRLPDEIFEKEDKKSAHNGTIEFTSCDAHRGCLPSFRGDLEILAHNMLYWLTGSLPWENEQDPMKVFKAKKHLIENVETELPKLIKNKKALSIVRLIYKVVRKMKFNEQIDVPGILKLL